MTAKSITQKRLKEILHYDPETGVFTWLIRAANRIKVGDIAGSPHNLGYIQITVGGRKYFAQRLAFLCMTGEFPIDEVDHKNHIRDDNRWKNIRQADRTMNMRNASMHSNNTSGYTGVYWRKAISKWVAQIGVNGKPIHLGFFIDIGDAIVARKAAEIKHGFHENHGAKQHD